MHEVHLNTKEKNMKNTQYFKLVEDCVDVLCTSTGNTDRAFFRNITIFIFGIMASSMRTNVHFKDRGKPLPVNTYVVNLASSGFSKTRSLSILDGQLVGKFKKKFMEETYGIIATQKINALAQKRAELTGIDLETILEDIISEVEAAGANMFYFDSGTPEGFKQMRRKLITTGAGSLNFVGDELAVNLVKNTELLGTLIQAYDLGEIKDKLITNSTERKRNESQDGRVPTNVLLFGTPDRLLGGSKLEDILLEWIESGYGRRCLFGYVNATLAPKALTPEQRYDQMVNTHLASSIEKLSNHFEGLADITNFEKTIEVSKEVSIALLEYEAHCVTKAASLGKYSQMEQTEQLHRYFKVIKLAGIFAFVGKEDEVSMKTLQAAISYVEDSGEAFKRILNRDSLYVTLAKYLGGIGREVTQIDIIQDLPMFKGNKSQKSELILMAITWGYSNGIVIKTRTINGIEFYKGDMVETTDIDNCIVSCSTSHYEDFITGTVAFQDLNRVSGGTRYPYWSNHTYKEGNCDQISTEAGFNLLPIKLRGSVSVLTAQKLFKPYKHLIYLEKGSDGEDISVVVVLCLSHTLFLSAEDYIAFIDNISVWMPVEVKQESRHTVWQGNLQSQHSSEGKFVDVFNFIPKTSKADTYKKNARQDTSMSKVQRWFLHDFELTEGLQNYAEYLTGDERSLQEVKDTLVTLNASLKEGLSEEVFHTQITQQLV